MKFSKFIVIPIIVAVLAAIIQAVDQLVSTTTFFSTWSGFGWISFQSWALYFLAGCTLKGGIRALIGYFVGAVASMAIITLAGYFACLGFWAVPASLLILVVPIICLERVPWFDLVPAIFIGSGAFFAIVTYVPETSFCTALTIEMTYCIIGLIFGVTTIMLRQRYEAYVEKNK